MATQEFLDGGFIGRMGQVVGQHWHNKRYVRTYVVPANPQTPEQQTNRGRFARAVALMQQANMLNAGDASWITTARGESQLRTGAAASRLIAGKSDAEALPLFPDNWTYDQLIAMPIITYNNTNNTINLKSTSAIFDHTRKVFVLLHAYSRENNTWADVIQAHTITGNQSFDITLQTTAVVSMPADSYVIATTEPNTVYQQRSYTLLKTPTAQPVKPYYTAALTLKEIKPDSEGDAAAYFTSDKYIDASFIELTVKVRAKRIGSGWETVNWGVYFNADRQLEAYIYDDEQIEYPAGSKILAGDENDGDNNIIFHTNEQAFSYP